MFGDFLQNFGLNAFPWDSLDPQGGLFGQNAPQTPLIGSQEPGAAPGPQVAHNPGGPGLPQGSSPSGGQNSPLSPGGQSQLANPAGFGAPGAANPAPTQPIAPAPAAGVGSAFGNPLQ